MDHAHIFRDKRELISKTITQDDTVLDVGFWGQGTSMGDPDWPHRLLIEHAKHVDGIDITLDAQALHTINSSGTYIEASAESFSSTTKYSKIFAADVIEHLPNPGLFLNSCKQALGKGGALIITTPNTYNLFNIAGKLMHDEPVVNKDHTCYFNVRTLATLLTKCGWRIERVGYVYTLGELHEESWKKKVLNGIYRLASTVTPKYLETLVVIAQPTT